MFQLIVNFLKKFIREKNILKLESLYQCYNLLERLNGIQNINVTTLIIEFGLTFIDSNVI